ncbi:MAG: hypothetical protein O3A00_16595 [Planctomycetota bacterium]|nr:hypothetical protein [Planctomycetota bacterium]
MDRQRFEDVYKQHVDDLAWASGGTAGAAAIPFDVYPWKSWRRWIHEGGDADDSWQRWIHEGSVSETVESPPHEPDAEGPMLDCTGNIHYAIPLSFSEEPVESGSGGCEDVIYIGFRRCVRIHLGLGRL